MMQAPVSVGLFFVLLACATASPQIEDVLVDSECGDDEGECGVSFRQLRGVLRAAEGSDAHVEAQELEEEDDEEEEKKEEQEAGYHDHALAQVSEDAKPFHQGLPCWYKCNQSSGLCEDYCGTLGSCCQYGDLSDAPACHGVKHWPVHTFHTCVLGSAEEAKRARGGRHGHDETPRKAPLHKFYVYRAVNGTVASKYPFGNVNAGNLAGVMWYLTNEVLGLSHCPKRYGINQISRFLVKTQATPELFARGMNFGVRYSYDRGRCTGSNTKNLGPCDLTWKRFGYVPGCNAFTDHYPWPTSDTAYPDGIWYDFPNEGKCKSPTGSWDCTWSVEPAGHISIEKDLEAPVQGSQYCCHGNCTDFWKDPHSTSRCSDRVEQAMSAFKKKYPKYPKDVPPPACNFDRSQFWAGWKSAQ